MMTPRPLLRASRRASRQWRRSRKVGGGRTGSADQEGRPMGIDGTYGFVYCGNRGLGIGVFLIEGQRIEGRDFAGGVYKGTAAKDGKGNIEIDVRMHVSAGVETAEPQDL